MGISNWEQAPHVGHIMSLSWLSVPPEEVKEVAGET